MTQRYNLDSLEFQTVRDVLVARLTTPLGRTGLEKLGPLPSPEAARETLQQVAELAARSRDTDAAPLPKLEDVRGWLPGFLAGDHLPTIGDLVDLRRLLAAVSACRAWLQSRQSHEALCRMGLAFPDVRDIAEELGAVIDSSGEVVSTASPKLGQIRKEIEVADQGVRHAVQRFLSDDRIYKHLQNPEPSWRHGRPVFQVKQESRQVVPGVLHDRSASGATVFIEPESVVSAVNVLSDARAAEHREIQVILVLICRALRRYDADLELAVQSIVTLDVALAKSTLVDTEGYQVPEIADDGVLRLEDARHPLLLRTMPREHIQPLSLVLGDRFSVLVVTGPNTGGKTVVLKTIGLLSLMAISGVPIPAAATSRIPFFDGVFVDLGDEQGITQNLSTFSSHVKRIARCLVAATTRSLVLMDELGAGTDPEEGGALGYAVLKALEEQRVFSVVTTHLGRLKDFAYQHSGAENGSMAFDREQHQPLYRLELGIPGASHALDIADRVGMPHNIVAAARELLGQRDQRMEEAIERVHTARLHAEENRRRGAELVRSADEKDKQLDDRLVEMDRRRAWLEEEADAVVDAGLKGVRDFVEESLKELGNAPKPFGDRARGLLQEVREHLQNSNVHRRRMKFLGGLRKDGVVYVPRLAKRCTVKKLDRTREVLTIEVGKMRIEIPFEDVSWLHPLD